MTKQPTNMSINLPNNERVRQSNGPNELANKLARYQSINPSNNQAAIQETKRPKELTTN